MLLTLIYRSIIGLVIVFVGWNLYPEKSFPQQLNCALVLIPLTLRLLMIK